MKSLEARKADRAKRNEQAEAEKKQAGEILATGTVAGAQESEEEEEEEAADYSDYTVAELKEELDARSIEYGSDAKKADLVKMLEDSDNEG